jgi:signal transduction histidine kinase
MLLVDDDEDDYMIFRDMVSEFRDWEVQLQWVSSYEAALKVAKPGAYDVCLMDYRLDRGNGIELMKEFQKDGFTFPVIILTGRGDHEVDMEAMREGAADYLEKGQVNPHLLERAIRYAIEHCKNLEALRQSENQLRILSAKLMEAQESERKRVAHELHDSIGASLTAVKYGLEREVTRASEGGRCLDGGMLSQLTSTVEATIKDLKRIYGNLRPLILDDLGLLPAIRSLVRQFREVRPNVNFEESIQAEESEVPEGLKIVIYRLIQEALNNISKHSEANRVELALSRKRGSLVLSIRDDGRGFDLREVLVEEGHRHKLGLQSMKERGELSGGSFAILSSKGKGTMIRVVWPLG